MTGVVLWQVGALQVTMDIEGFEEIAQRTDLTRNLELLTKLSKIVHKWTIEVQRQAVANVSGGTVMYSGGTFIIHRQTGKLARSIQSSFPNMLSGLVIADAKYAAAIEGGVPYPVDLKPSLMGKTVFIRIDPTKGNVPKDLKSFPTFASTGARAGNTFGIFRRVGPKSTGWIIPPRKPRPFMRAAAEAILPHFEAEVMDAFREALRGEVL